MKYNQIEEILSIVVNQFVNTFIYDKHHGKILVLANKMETKVPKHKKMVNKEKLITIQIIAIYMPKNRNIISLK